MAPGTQAPPPRARARGPGVLALPAAAGLVLIAAALGYFRGQAGLFPAFLGAGGFLLAWTWALAARRDVAQGLEVTSGVRKHHWIQALAQITVLLYWGWHVRFVYDFLPLIAAQIVFAYGVDSLLSWTRRGTYAVGFGPFPVILSINLFLWVLPEWFYWQFAMIAVGYIGKDLIRWRKNGRSAHIFNPSSLPLALFSIGLILTDGAGITAGEAIASSQFYPPHMYAVIFLAALPGQLLFGVARMTMPAVLTAYGASLVFFQTTGTYLFFDSHIPVPVFLGMHLLFTDPSTSPRTKTGRTVFGILYGAGVCLAYVLLSAAGLPTFYDKLLPVPLLNLAVRRIDRLVEGAAGWRHRRGAPLERPTSPVPSRHLAYTFTWVLAFGALYAARGVGDEHPGQALPFWWEACREGERARACEYATVMTRIYCGDGSGWACNEVGLLRLEVGQAPGDAFARACQLGFQPGCENQARTGPGPRDLVRAAPRMADLPVLLRGTKPPLTEWTEAELQSRACRHGWSALCRSSVESGWNPRRTGEIGPFQHVSATYQ